MFPDPLRNIGLRCHCTLSQRTLPGELEALFFAQVRLPQSANHHDDLDHALPRQRDGNPPTNMPQSSQTVAETMRVS
jgi:hypothetical protein